MTDKKRKFYITTSIAYANASPHIGFSQELVQADVLARFHRSLGYETFFLTGTDEHGGKIKRAAEASGKSPKEFVDEISGQFRNLKKILNLSNDDFIRTTDQKRHWPAVKKVWLSLKENQDIYKKQYRAPYCLGCEAFLKEKDLVSGKCPVHQKIPEIIEEENYFFRLSRYSEQIEKAIKKDEIKIIPAVRKREILNFIKEGLEDISVSRARKNLDWGIPVPGDESQTIYIWLEALVNYISALGYAGESEKFKKFWPADIHCLGKDIFKFHVILWPAILFSLNLKLPKKVLVHGFITVGGKKISKSLGNIVNSEDLVNKYGTDALRYFLLREIPATEDGDFTYEKFDRRYNSDLSGGLGNLAARVITMAKNSKSQIPNSKQIPNPKFQTAIARARKNYQTALGKFKFNEALISVWEFIGFCDRYIENEKPWEKSKKQKEVIADLLSALAKIAELLAPFLPETSEKILRQIKTGKKELLFPKKT